VQLVYNISDVLARFRSLVTRGSPWQRCIIYIYCFIIILGRNFFIFLRMVSSPYASKTARVYAVTATIFYCLSVARYSLQRVSSVPCRMSTAAAVGGARRGVRCGGGRPSPCHPDTWRMQRVYGWVCLRHGKCGCSRPTINGQCSDLLWFENSQRVAPFLVFLLVVHVVIRRVVFTLSITVWVRVTNTCGLSRECYKWHRWSVRCYSQSVKRAKAHWV